MKQPIAAFSRRGVITAAAGAGVVMATAHLSRPSQALPGTPAPAAKAAGSEGYRLTEHIRQYYRTTLV